MFGVGYANFSFRIIAYFSTRGCMISVLEVRESKDAGFTQGTKK